MLSDKTTGETSFRFKNDKLNRLLAELLDYRDIPHRRDDSGAILFSEDVADRVDNELVSAVRRFVFPSWQVVTCPSDCTDVYRSYMQEKGIPFEEETTNGTLWFLIPRKCRVDQWNIQA